MVNKSIGKRNTAVKTKGHKSKTTAKKCTTRRISDRTLKYKLRR
jgi:hypothetical protein